MDAQREADNHGAERIVVDQCSSRVKVNHSINNLVRKGLQPHLSTVEKDISENLLPHKIPSFNFDGIHPGAGRERERERERERGENPDHMITPWGEGCWVKLSKIVILCYYVSIFYLINYCKKYSEN